MTEMSKKFHIIVVGGSLAGLMNAIPLKRLGHKVTILERSPVPLLHDQGAGVVAGSETLRWIARHGRSRRTAEDISVLSEQRLYLDKQGNVTDRETSHQRMTSWGVLYNIGRECFDGALRGHLHTPSQNGSLDDEASGEASYKYGRAVIGVEDKGDQIEVRCKSSRSDESEIEGEDTILGDFLIVADGPSSHLRDMLHGTPESSKRSYAGYVAFRGTVPEVELSKAAKDVFVEKFSFFHGTDPNTQILAYTIPNAEGNLQPGERLVNWVWYHNVEDTSDEYIELMTDKNGKRHRFTLPTGGHMQTNVWQNQQQTARRRLPHQFAELVSKTQKPFVQAITDLEPPKDPRQVARLLDGKAVIVGDALAGFRPHTAASTSQAAFDALMLEQVFKGEMSWDQYEEQVWSFAKNWQAHGVRLGQRSQFGMHPLAA